MGRRTAAIRTRWIAAITNRTSLWPLRYRGELRKKVLEHIFGHGLLHPEDADASDDFSMHASLKRVERSRQLDAGISRINPHSEQTLKSNSENDCCRSHQYELVRHPYTPELWAYWERVLKKVDAGDRNGWLRPRDFVRIGAGPRDRLYAAPKPIWLRGNPAARRN